MPYVKETLINLTSLVWFTSVILLILYQEKWRLIAIICVGMACITLVYPPIGWLRPTRHSDRNPQVITYLLAYLLVLFTYLML